MRSLAFIKQKKDYIRRKRVLTASSLTRPASLMPQYTTRFQIGIIALCVCIAGLDGFDVLVVAYTAPAIAKDWHLSPATIGTLFSAGLAGMGFGALLIAPLGDRLGRRPAILLCLCILFAGMLTAAFTRSVFELGLVRAFTGLGIGGVLANVNIVASEYASARRRDLCVALMSVGYPIGATIGGVAAVYLIQAFGWRSVYVFGALVALLLVPLTLVYLPESLDFLLARQPSKALARSNRVLAKLGLRPLQVLPSPAEIEAGQRASAFTIFRPEFLAITLVTSFLYLSVMATCYFLLSWTPKLLTDLGLSVSGGISGSLLLNIGGTVGCILYGLFAVRLGIRRLATFFMLGLVGMTVLFGFIPPVQGLLLVGAMAVGFCLHTSITVLYVVVPSVFPAAIRATGTGFAMSIGRVGAVIGPFVAGLLMQFGYHRPVYCAVLALPMLVAVACLYGLRGPDAPLTPALDPSAVPVA